MGRRNIVILPKQFKKKKQKEEFLCRRNIVILPKPAKGTIELLKSLCYIGFY